MPRTSFGWLPDSNTPLLNSAFGRAVSVPCSNFFVLWFVMEDILVVGTVEKSYC